MFSANLPVKLKIDSQVDLSEYSVIENLKSLRDTLNQSINNLDRKRKAGNACSIEEINGILEQIQFLAEEFKKIENLFQVAIEEKYLKFKG